MVDREGNSESERLAPAVVAALYAQHAAELRSYLLGLLRDADLAAEVLQTTFAKAAELGHTVQHHSRRVWLFRVAHNEAMDRRRRSAVEDRVVRTVAWWNRTREEPSDHAANRDETIDRVRRAIVSLPDEQRTVVRLRIYEEKTFAEIAGMLGVPLGTVLTRMRLATRKLADALKDERDA